MYDIPFIIDKPVSNNAFSFDERKKFHQHTPSIHVASLTTASPTELRKGSKTVFEELEDSGNSGTSMLIKSCVGLEQFIKTTFGPDQKPVYIFDNHNHAFYFWHHERNHGRLSAPIALIHVDQHKDTRQPPEFLSEQDALDDKKLFHYTNTVLNVGNFIPPAIKTGLITKVINIDSEFALDTINQKLPQNYILDIDIDFFAPEMNYINREKSMTAVSKLLRGASMITIATSPFFMDQSEAIKIVRQIFSCD